MTRDYIELACVSHYHVIATIEIRKRSVELVDAYLRDLVGCRRKDGLFFWSICGQSLPVDSLVKCCTACKLRKRRGARFKTVMRIRITLPLPASPNCREIPLAFSPEIRETCPLFAIFAQQHGLERTDCWGSHGLKCASFLWMAHAESGFKDRIRRMRSKSRASGMEWLGDGCWFRG
jgi:hypothetical protein